MRKSILIAFLSLLSLASAKFAVQEPKRYLLKDPSVIQVELAPSKDQADDKRGSSDGATYEAGSRVSFRLDAVNISQEVVTIVIWDKYFQNRPELWRDGEKSVYRDGLSAVLEERDTELPRSLPQALRLDPGERKRIGYIELPDWYGPLEPGHYQLAVKHRFEPGQNWIESAAITFEVIPKKRRAKTVTE